MAEQTARPDAADDLRVGVVEKAAASSEAPNPHPVSETAQALHDLHVHQIELQTQNEELRRIQVELEASRARYFDLYDLAPVGYFTVSGQGLLLEANFTAATMLGVTRGDLATSPLSRFILPEDQDIYYRHCQQLLATGKPQVSELRMLRANAAHFWARLETTLGEDGDGATVCRAALSDITPYKGAEEESRRAREDWQRTFDAVPDLIAIVDPERRVLRVNQAMADHLGVSRDACVGRLCYDLLHRDEPPETCRLHRFALDGREHTSEVRAEALHRDFLVTVSPLQDSGDRMSGCVHVARDITESRRGQRERETTLTLLRLLNDENHLHELLCNLTGFLQQWSGCEAVGVRLRDGDDFPYYETRGFPQEFVQAENQLCQCDLDGQIVRDSIGNPVLECMCGNILCGRVDPSLPFFTPHGSFWSNCTSALLANTTEADRQARTRNRCNGEGYESVALIPLRHGNQTLGLLQLNDHAPGRFTPELIVFIENAADQIAIALAQRQTQAALRESESRYRTLFTAMAEGFALHEIICDENGVPHDYRFLDVNPAFERLTGLTRDVIGKTLRAIMPNETPMWIENYGTVALTGRPLQFEGYSPVLDKHFAVFAYSPAPRQFAAVFMDITRRKVAEEQQQHLRQQLRHVNRLSTLGEMVAGIAHEVNQPLYSIVNYAKACGNILKQDGHDKERLVAWNERIVSEAVRAGEIIARIRSLARNEAVRRLPNAIGEVINESLALTDFEMRRLGVKVCRDGSESSLMASFDRIQIQQVLVNLLRNACEAMEQSPPLERRLTIRTALDGHFVEVVVSDTGPGLQGVDPARIFDAFVTSKPAGMGMGLAVSKSIIEAHGGRLWVSAGAERGAAFHFTVPSTNGEHPHA